MNNNIIISTSLYRIYFNNDVKFERCFEYDNALDVNYKNDKLRNYKIECKQLKIKNR